MIISTDLYTEEILIEEFPIITPTYPDEIGRTFDELTILYQTDAPNNTTSLEKIWYMCRCACGNLQVSPRIALFRRLRTSCDQCMCERKKIDPHKTLKKYNKNWIPLRNCWANMMNRCYKSKDKKYPRYGGRGIKVCDEWRDPISGFINFYNWALSTGYVYYKNKKKLLTIDRIDNDGNYEPSNCRWLTRKEQNRNTSRNVYFIINGEIKLLQDLVDEYGVSHRTILGRCISGKIQYEYCNVDPQDKLDFYNKRGKYKKENTDSK